MDDDNQYVLTDFMDWYWLSQVHERHWEAHRGACKMEGVLGSRHSSWVFNCLEDVLCIDCLA